MKNNEKILFHIFNSNQDYENNICLIEKQVIIY